MSANAVLTLVLLITTQLAAHIRAELPPRTDSGASAGDGEREVRYAVCVCVCVGAPALTAHLVCS